MRYRPKNHRQYALKFDSGEAAWDRVRGETAVQKNYQLKLTLQYFFSVASRLACSESVFHLTAKEEVRSSGSRSDPSSRSTMAPMQTARRSAVEENCWNCALFCEHATAEAARKPMQNPCTLPNLEFAWKEAGKAAFSVSRPRRQNSTI